jgi:S-adenosylmethionine-diacylglycerol 3-amino-3-carboxypropyl transferase
MIANRSDARKRSHAEAALERALFTTGLVFNQTWEDPAVDREALAITGDETVLAIASAGDNVLDLALAGARKIYAVDLNPAQVHLLQLKIAAAQRLDSAGFRHLFALAPASAARDVYHAHLRQHLAPDARAFWDRRLSLLERGLYLAGKFGRALATLRLGLRLACGRQRLEQFFACQSLAEQAGVYQRYIRPRWWNALARPFAASGPVLALFGAHPHQAWRVRGQGFAHALEAGITRALTTLPARDNYFWQQAFLGRYLQLPPYLRPENYARLQAGVAAIEVQHGRVEALLARLPPGSIDCANLLDAPDWLGPEATAAWWARLRPVLSSRGRVLFRTVDPSYRLPPAVLADWQDATDPAWTARERTGVYAGVHVLVDRAMRKPARVSASAPALPPTPALPPRAARAPGGPD